MLMNVNDNEIYSATSIIFHLKKTVKRKHLYIKFYTALLNVDFEVLLTL